MSFLLLSQYAYYEMSCNTNYFHPQPNPTPQQHPFPNSLPHTLTVSIASSHYTPSFSYANCQLIVVAPKITKLGVVDLTGCTVYTDCTWLPEITLTIPATSLDTTDRHAPCHVTTPTLKINSQTLNRTSK